MSLSLTPQQAAECYIAAFATFSATPASTTKIQNLLGGITVATNLLSSASPGTISPDRVTRLCDAMHAALTEITTPLTTYLTTMPAAPVALQSATPAEATAAPCLAVESTPLAGAGGGGATAVATEFEGTPPKSQLETVMNYLNKGYEWAIEGGVWTTADLIKLASLDRVFYQQIDERAPKHSAMERHLNDIYSKFFLKAHAGHLSRRQQEDLPFYTNRPDRAWKDTLEGNTHCFSSYEPTLTWEMIQKAAEEVKAPSA